MCGVPILGDEGAQGCKHNRFELGKVDAAALELRDAQGQHIALLLKAVRIRHVGDDGVEGCQHLVHPRVLAESHHRCVKEEHLVEGCGHRSVVRSAIRIRLARGALALTLPCVVRLSRTELAPQAIRSLLLLLLLCIFLLAHHHFPLLLLLNLPRLYRAALLILLLFPTLRLRCQAVHGHVINHLVVCRGPARRKDLQAVGVLQPDVDVCPTGVVEECSESLLRLPREGCPHVQLEQIDDRVPEDHNPRNGYFQIQVLKAQSLDHNFQVLWGMKGRDDVGQSAHEPHRHHRPGRLEEALQARRGIEKGGVDGFTGGLS
mmetsp:Transcript_114647/g.255844  ORF Transcript_114647/g.255844 Transcript_114647/m.255844 type:complete len:318 (+) Transcript_114647:834-1787(+)